MYYFIFFIIKCKFVNEVKKNEQRQLLQNRYSYIPSPHTILYILLMIVQFQEPKKRQQKVTNLKKTTGLCPSRSSFSSKYSSLCDIEDVSFMMLLAKHEINNSPSSKSINRAPLRRLHINFILGTLI